MSILFDNNVVREYLALIKLYTNKYQNLRFETKTDILKAGYVNGIVMVSESEYTENKDKYPQRKILVTKEPLCNTLYSYLLSTLRNKRILKDYIITYNNNELCGIIVAENGECIEHPGIWSIRIICNYSSQLKPDCVGFGTTLIGVYLYCIKNIGQYYGLLELAYGYQNLTAFCAYSKFNFKENHKYECDNFSYNNVIMTSDLGNISKLDIVNIVTGKLVLKKPSLCEVKEPVVIERIQNILGKDYFKKFDEEKRKKIKSKRKMKKKSSKKRKKKKSKN